jgi:hypothetical protein
MLSALRYPVSIVAHDAGAANHIIAWFRDADLGRIRPCLAGPALALWRQAFPDAAIAGLLDSMAGAGTLISGTGWASDLEHDARTLARQAGIKSIAVLDHWTSYRERFVRNGEETLPDEIWVTDEYAKVLAEKQFGSLVIRQLPNLYLDRLVREVGKHDSTPRHSAGANVLYVLEPIRHAWGPSPVPGEFRALDFFADHTELIGPRAGMSIRLRAHPSDPPGKYDAWVARNKTLDVSMDESPTLAQSIAWSHVVVGCQTYAMVIALGTGRRVVSSIPPGAPPCVLPHHGIIKLSELLQAASRPAKAEN